MGFWMGFGISSATKTRQEACCPFGTSDSFSLKSVGGQDVLCHSLCVCVSQFGRQIGIVEGRNNLHTVTLVTYQCARGRRSILQTGLATKYINSSYHLSTILSRITSLPVVLLLVLCNFRCLKSQRFFKKSVKDKYFNIDCHDHFI